VLSPDAVLAVWQSAMWCAFSLFVLTSAACVVAWADGAPFPLHLALVPFWVVDAGCFLASMVAFIVFCHQEWRRGRGHRCRNTALGFFGFLFAWAAGSLLILTPILVSLKADGIYNIPWVMVCVPALISTASMGLGGCGVGREWGV
jgi:hypothetical protein